MSNGLKKKAGPRHKLADLQDIRVLIAAKAVQKEHPALCNKLAYLDVAYTIVDELIKEGYLPPRDEFIITTPMIKDIE